VTAHRLISVIVPCYNQALYLDETLQSVWEQSYPDWECLIVDDGSADNSKAIANAWCEKDNRFRLIPKQHGGVSQARNVGIEQAMGKFILPLDGDDKISTDYIEGCLEEFEKHPETKLVYGKAFLFGAEKGEWHLPDFNYHQLLTRNLIYCTAMYRKSDWQAIGGYDEKMVHGLEDWDFWIRLLNGQEVVTRLRSVAFYYRIKSSSRNADLYKNETTRQETYDYLYRKHYDQMKSIIGNPLQLYVENEDLSNQVIRLQQQLKNPFYFRMRQFAHNIKKKFQ
jgi:glycosyltransferase involved in cell wall biosynthesis